MSEINTGGGASVQGDANTGGGDLAGRDDRRQYEQRSGASVTFQGGDYGDAAIWREIVGLGKDISAVNIRLDDLPDRVKVIEVRLMAGVPPASNSLSLVALYWIMGGGFLLTAGMIATQVILQAVR